jgi:hypothetical protein
MCKNCDKTYNQTKTTMKKYYLYATLAFATSVMAFDSTPLPIPPDCTLIPATGATATSGVAGAAIDGNGATRWESAFNDAESLTIDMGAVVSINTVTIDWETANAKDYIVRGSTDGTTWTDIESLTNMPAGERTDVVDGINASYRYIRVDGVSRNTAYGYSIWELFVCADAIVVPDCTPVALASATATTGVAAAAIDDNLATRWESAFEDPQTLTVDLGVVDFVKEVSISWETANAKDYTLSGSVNGTDWTLIETLTDMPAGPRVDEFEIEAEYRYFQMHGTARNTAYGYSIFEFDVCVGEEGGPVVPVPFECDSPLTPISAVGSSGNGAAAIDDNDATRWESDATDVQNLIVDMGELVSVTAVTIDWETANAKDYTLSGSADGIVWTVIETLTNMPTGERTDEILDIDTDYRYLKIDGIARNTIYGYSIWEFNVCGEEIDVPPPPFECDSPLEAESATASTGNAAAAIDGIAGTRWESEAADPQSLTVDMGETVEVYAVTIDWETANAKDYTLSGSIDGTVWTVIETLTDMPTGERTDEILDINTDYRYLRMDGIARNTPYGYSIWEFNVCGEAPEVEIDYVEVPALIEAENWHAMQGVATEPTADTGGGESVGWIDAGDWMDYAIEVETAGEYVIDARVASTADTGVIEYFSNGASLGTVNVVNTGGWQVWQTISKNVTLAQGEQMLRLSAAAAPFNLNWIEVKAQPTQGLEGFKAAGISMYPNPANSQVNISLHYDAQLSLYTYTGVLVAQHEVKAGENTIGLDGLAAGIYFVKVNNHIAKLIVK